MLALSFDEELLDDVRSLFPADLDPVLRAGVERAFRSHDLSRPPVRIGRLVYEAITGERAPLRLTTVSALVHIGAGLHDDVADGDIAGGREREAEALLISGLCLATLAPRAVCTLVPSALLARALDALWTGLETMAAGQRRDVALFHAELPDLREVESALTKTSGEIGLAAALGALAAQCDEASVREWQSFGAEVGYGLQLASDCQDVADPASRDIASGARTLPIAFALHELDTPARRTLLDQLRGARRDRAAHSGARNALLDTRALHASLTLVEARIARAERRLSELTTVDPAPLASFIAGISWLRRA